jgi:acyl-CoA synthetase (AMP-forming)/AMP-acid ligase II
VPDEQWGEIVGALIVPSSGDRLDEDELLAYCRQHLAGFKIPRMVRFAPSLPASAAGKILKREIRDQFVAELALE